MRNKWKTSLRYNRITSSISFKNCLCRDHIWTARESVTPDDAAIDGLICVRCEIRPVWSRRSDPSWLVGLGLITPLLRIHWPNAEIDANFIQITQKSARMQDEAALLRVHWGTPTQMPDYAAGPVISSLPSPSLPFLSFPLLGQITLQSLFIFSSCRSYFTARCQGRVMDEKNPMKSAAKCLIWPEIIRQLSLKSRWSSNSKAFIFICFFPSNSTQHRLMYSCNCFVLDYIIPLHDPFTAHALEQ